MENRSSILDLPIPELIMATDLKNGTEPGIASLVGGIVHDAQELIRQQFVLLRRELQQEMRQARTAAVSLMIGVGLAAVGGVLLLVMLVHLLEAKTDLPLWGCYAMVGGVLGAVGLVLLLFGRQQASDVHVAPPPQTAEAVKENVQWLTGQTTPNGS